MHFLQLRLHASADRKCTESSLSLTSLTHLVANRTGDGTTGTSRSFIQSRMHEQVAVLTSLPCHPWAFKTASSRQWIPMVIHGASQFASGTALLVNRLCCNRPFCPKVHHCTSCFSCSSSLIEVSLGEGHCAISIWRKHHHASNFFGRQ